MSLHKITRPNAIDLVAWKLGLQVQHTFPTFVDCGEESDQSLLRIEMVLLPLGEDFAYAGCSLFENGRAYAYVPKLSIYAPSVDGSDPKLMVSMALTGNAIFEFTKALDKVRDQAIKWDRSDYEEILKETMDQAKQLLEKTNGQDQQD